MSNDGIDYHHVTGLEVTNETHTANVKRKRLKEKQAIEAIALIADAWETADNPLKKLMVISTCEKYGYNYLAERYKREVK
jgi:hypothetical protein